MVGVTGKGVIYYHHKSMPQGQVIHFRNWPYKLPEETNLQIAIR